MKRAALLFLLTACPDPQPQAPDAGSSVQLDPNNTDGYQFQTPEFTIPEGKEYQDCYFVAMPDLASGSDYYIDRFRIGANPGTHHVNVFRVKTIVNLDGAPGTMVHGEDPRTDECFKSGNWADWPLVVNNQNSDVGNYFDWRLPTGVAQKFSAGEKLMVQVHYVNASTQDTPATGKVVLDMYHSTQTAPMEMGTLFATQQSIRICQSNPSVTFHRTCLFQNQPVTIAAANGHFHSRGTSFSIFRWDGQSTSEPPVADRFYLSEAWDHPDMRILATGLPAPAGSGIWWTCEYEWMAPDAAAGGCAAVDARDPSPNKDCCYTFGPIVETSEHCNVFLYYYPQIAGSDITCF